ncbi:MAG: hypothetical protein ABIL09_12555 [Gemmatimonadota bacterium]
MMRIALALLLGLAAAEAQEPTWIDRLPTGEQYQYFRGEGLDPDLESAQTKARADAFRKALIWSQQVSVGSVRDEIALSSRAREVATHITLLTQDATLSGVEWIDDWTGTSTVTDTLSTPAYPGRRPSALTTTRTVYYHYLLIRLPRKGPGLVGAAAQGVGHRFDAVFHSALYPGWGQYRQHRIGEGNFYACFGTLAALSAGTFYALEHYHFGEAQKDKWYATQDWRHYRQGTTYAFAGLWAVAVVDAFLFGRKEQTGLTLRAGPQSVLLVAWVGP